MCVKPWVLRVIHLLTCMPHPPHPPTHPYHCRQGICTKLLNTCSRALLPHQLQNVYCWQRLSAGQRGALVGGSACLAVVLIVVIAVTATSSGSSSSRLGSNQYGRVPSLMAASDSPYCSWHDLYLPKAVQPQQYTLVLKTDMQPPYLVEGSVQIRVTAGERTPCVVLHSVGMNITGVALQLESPGAPGGTEVIPGG